MIQINEWMPALVGKLKAHFSERLLFAGLQGSYRRGEATEKSDIDVVLILDELGVQDLRVYREILDSMPEGEKSCGFVSGRREFRNWPKYEIFQLSRETKAWYGELEPLLPEVGEKDIRDSIKISAAGMYHAICHMYLHGHGADNVSEIRGHYKTAFFLLQLLHYVRSGAYVETREELLARLDDREQRILSIGMNWDSLEEERRENPDFFFELLINWASSLLKQD